MYCAAQEGLSGDPHVRQLGGLNNRRLRLDHTAGSARVRATQRLDGEIGRVLPRHKGRYGAPRITAELKATGLACSENRVARRMRQLGLKACQAKQFKVTTDPLYHKLGAPELL